MRLAPQEMLWLFNAVCLFIFCMEAVRAESAQMAKGPLEAPALSLSSFQWFVHGNSYLAYREYG